MTRRSYEDEIRAVGVASGLDAVGIAPATAFAGTERDLVERKEAGLHGGMQFTYRRPSRSTDPSRALPTARSLVVGARSYRMEAPSRPTGSGPVARVARYAWADHYGDLRRALDQVSERLQRDGWATRVLVDENALVDREAAVRAGLGWYGKSSNVLLPGHGSWFVLGSVLTDAELVPAVAPAPDGCGSCRRCLDGCPTGAIVAPGVVDARRCLAWLVQAPGSFPRRHRIALGDRIYGCDDCQEVCPPNRQEDRRPVPRPISGPGRHEAWVPILELLAASDDELLARHGRWYIARRDPVHLRRTALVGLGHTADPAEPEVVAPLRRHLVHPHPCSGPTPSGPPVASVATTSSPPPTPSPRTAIPRSEQSSMRLTHPCGSPPPSPAPVREAPARHERLPAQARWHPVLPVGALAAPAA
ncbi:MAG: tRNA epoxyqueuosine(34) reductase QueG [Acidimicrobiales bacterium]